MVWVKSEYAGELAVVSAWISALLPWYVGVTPDHAEFPGTVAFVRFPWAQVRYIFGFELAEAVRPDHPLGARELTDRTTGAYLESIHLAYDLWIVGALLLALAVLLSVAMYADVQRVEELSPIHPVRLMGGLLGTAGLVFAAATVLFFQRSVFGEYPIPVGLLVLLVLAGILLQVDLVDDAAADDAAAGDGTEDGGTEDDAVPETGGSSSRSE